MTTWFLLPTGSVIWKSILPSHSRPPPPHLPRFSILSSISPYSAPHISDTRPSPTSPPSHLLPAPVSLPAQPHWSLILLQWRLHQNHIELAVQVTQVKCVEVALQKQEHESELKRPVRTSGNSLKGCQVRFCDWHGLMSFSSHSWFFDFCGSLSVYTCRRGSGFRKTSVNEETRKVPVATTRLRWDRLVGHSIPWSFQTVTSGVTDLE